MNDTPYQLPNNDIDIDIDNYGDSYIFKVLLSSIIFLEWIDRDLHIRFKFRKT
jgi:hypothetical protein